MQPLLSCLFWPDGAACRRTLRCLVNAHAVGRAITPRWALRALESRARCRRFARGRRPSFASPRQLPGYSGSAHASSLNCIATKSLLADYGAAVGGHLKHKEPPALPSTPVMGCVTRRRSAPFIAGPLRDPLGRRPRRRSGDRSVDLLRTVRGHCSRAPRATRHRARAANPRRPEKGVWLKHSLFPNATRHPVRVLQDLRAPPRLRLGVYNEYQ